MASAPTAATAAVASSILFRADSIIMYAAS